MKTPEPRIGYQRLSVLQLVLIAVVMVLILMYSIYHLTHEGTTSGTYEMISFGLLLLALFLPYRSKRTFRRLTDLQVAFIGTVDFFALFFGIYHMTRPDALRSGILELTSFTLLTIVIFIGNRGRRSRMRES